MQLYGIDFTSAPSRRKAITVAGGRFVDCSGPPVLGVESLLRLERPQDFEQWLGTPGPWLGGFDFPFGLPRELLRALNWPHEQGWPQMVGHLQSLTRQEMVRQFRAFCDARPAGGKFAHRAADIPAGSSPSMKWVNPPVAFMLHAGAPALLRAGVDLPGLHAGDGSRVALEAYPGLLARRVLGRESYKSDDRQKQTEWRRAARERLVGALVSGESTGMPRCQFESGLAQQCIDDASADTLDAVLCLAQAAWAWIRREQRYGLPADFDPVEGWIVSAMPADNHEHEGS